MCIIVCCAQMTCASLYVVHRRYVHHCLLCPDDLCIIVCCAQLPCALLSVVHRPHVHHRFKAHKFFCVLIQCASSHIAFRFRAKKVLLSSESLCSICLLYRAWIYTFRKICKTRDAKKSRKIKNSMINFKLHWNYGIWGLK